MWKNCHVPAKAVTQRVTRSEWNATMQGLRGARALCKEVTQIQVSNLTGERNFTLGFSWNLPHPFPR